MQMNTSKPHQTPEIPNSSEGLPVPVSLNVRIELPHHLYQIFTSMAKAFKTSPDRIVEDSVRFAIFLYQQGTIAKLSTLRETLVAQVAGFDMLRERLMIVSSAVEEAAHMSRAAVAQVKSYLAQRGGPKKE